jgi:hypothetical protein
MKVEWHMLVTMGKTHHKMCFPSSKSDELNEINRINQNLFL